MFKFVWILFSVTLMADIGIIESLKTRAIGADGERVTLSVNHNDAVLSLNLPYIGNFDDIWRDYNIRKFLQCNVMRKYIPDIYLQSIGYDINKAPIEKNGYVLKIFATGKGCVKSAIDKVKKLSVEKYTANVTVANNISYYTSVTNEYNIWGTIYFFKRTNDSFTFFRIKDTQYPRTTSINKLVQMASKVDQTIIKYFNSINVKPKSSQTFIHDTKAEPTEEKSNYCTKPIADDWKEYCANKAYNAKLDADEIVEDKKIEKALKAEDKYQNILDDWYEEDRQTNIKHIKGLDEQKRKSKEAEQKESRAFHDKLANDMKKRKEFQAEQQKNIKLINRFATGDKWSDAYQDIKRVDKTGDIEKSKELYKEHRKTYYDTHQNKLIKESKSWNEQAKQFDKASKIAETIRDTSINVNKILALPAVATASLGVIVSAEAVSIVTVSTTIPLVHSATTNAIAAYQKDGVIGTIVSVAKDGADQLTNKVAGDFIDQIYRKAKYHTSGVDIPSNIQVYGENKQRVTRIKSGDRVYDKNGKDITYSTVSKATQFEHWTTRANKDAQTGNPNKVLGGMLDVWGVVNNILR